MFHDFFHFSTLDWCVFAFINLNDFSLAQELDQLTMLIVGLLSTTIHKTPEATDI